MSHVNTDKEEIKYVRDVGVAGSNPVTPTIDSTSFFSLHRGLCNSFSSLCVTGCVTASNALRCPSASDAYAIHLDRDPAFRRRDVDGMFRPWNLHWLVGHDLSLLRVEFALSAGAPRVTVTSRPTMARVKPIASV